MLIVDGHEDLAYNTLVDGRDYLRSAFDSRADEADGPVPDGNGLCMLGLPEWLRGGVAIVVATLTAIPRADAHPGELDPNIHGWSSSRTGRGSTTCWPAHGQCRSRRQRQ